MDTYLASSDWSSYKAIHVASTSDNNVTVDMHSAYTVDEYGHVVITRNRCLFDEEIEAEEFDEIEELKKVLDYILPNIAPYVEAIKITGDSLLLAYILENFQFTNLKTLSVRNIYSHAVWSYSPAQLCSSPVLQSLLPPMSVSTGHLVDDGGFENYVYPGYPTGPQIGEKLGKFLRF